MTLKVASFESSWRIPPPSTARTGSAAVHGRIAVHGVRRGEKDRGPLFARAEQRERREGGPATASPDSRPPQLALRSALMLCGRGWVTRPYLFAQVPPYRWTTLAGSLQWMFRPTAAAAIVLSSLLPRVLSPSPSLSEARSSVPPSVGGIKEKGGILWPPSPSPCSM